MNRGVRFRINQKVIVLWVLTCVIFPLLPLTQAELFGNTWTGPWIDRLVFEVIQDDTQQVLALVNGDVDIIGGQINPIFLDQLYEAENVEVSEIPQYGYGLLNINCMKYPMNISHFRRALAFAMNKTRIIEEAWLGHADLLDCHLPSYHPAYIDDEMEYHYYNEDIEKGRELLELAGFNDTDEDGWLEGPGPAGPGTVDLDTIVVEGERTDQFDIYLDVVVNALLNLNISAEVGHPFWDVYNIRLDLRPDYDMIISTSKWSHQDLGLYVRDYMGKYKNSTFLNPSYWVNATWDSYATTLLALTDYDEIISTAKLMEHIWVEDCPAIVLFQNNYITGYRTDAFEGVVIDSQRGVSNFYTNLRIHIVGDVFGGDYTWANPLDTLSFNHFSLNSEYAMNIFDVIYDPLVRTGPSGNDILWMCQDFSVETHSDNPNVKEGHMEIIVDIIPNATWSDGTPITAYDFDFTIQYIHDNVPSFAVDLEDLVVCYSYGPTQLYCEFSSESYWHWHSIAYKYVIPSQVWADYENDFEEYQPTPATLQDMIGSGPFIPTAWVQGDFAELEQNPYYWRNPRNIENESTPITTISDTITTHNTIQSLGLPLAIIGSFVCVVAIGVVFLRYYVRRS